MTRRLGPGPRCRGRQPTTARLGRGTIGSAVERSSGAPNSPVERELRPDRRGVAPGGVEAGSFLFRRSGRRRVFVGAVSASQFHAGPSGGQKETGACRDRIGPALTRIPAGRIGDRFGMVRVLAAGVGAFGLAYADFAATGARIPLLATAFTLAGVGIGCAETAEHAAVATARTATGARFGLRRAGCRPEPRLRGSTSRLAKLELRDSLQKPDARSWAEAESLGWRMLVSWLGPSPTTGEAPASAGASWSRGQPAGRVWPRPSDCRIRLRSSCVSPPDRLPMPS